MMAGSITPSSPNAFCGLPAVATSIAAFVWLCACACLVAPQPAAAQVDYLDFKQQIRPTPKGPSLLKKEEKSDAPMLVKAGEIDYDYTNYRVAAVGNAQIHYNGATIEADRVIYDQKTKRLRAEGNARLTVADGKITYGEIIDLTDDYRDAFLDSLRVETAENPCEPCKDQSKKPPLWQVKAVRIIHNQTERMIYFEDAR
jgi:LPS-assembly protein